MRVECEVQRGVFSPGGGVPGPPLRAAGLLLRAPLAELGAGLLLHGVPLAPPDGAAGRGESRPERHRVLDCPQRGFNEESVSTSVSVDTHETNHCSEICY